MKYTFDQFLAVCSQQPEKMLKVLQDDLGFNEKDFRESIWGISPGKCRLFFGGIVGHPFDISDKERLYKLLDSVRHPATMAKVLYFLQDHQSPKLLAKGEARLARERKKPGWKYRKERYDKLVKEVSEFDIPVMDFFTTEKHPLNPFNKVSRSYIIFEHLIRFPGSKQQWPVYLRRLWKFYKLQTSHTRHNTDWHYFKGVVRKKGMSWGDLIGLLVEEDGK